MKTGYLEYNESNHWGLESGSSRQPWSRPPLMPVKPPRPPLCPPKPPKPPMEPASGKILAWMIHLSTQAHTGKDNHIQKITIL